MSLDIKAVRLKGALRQVRELTDANHLIVNSEQSLIAVAWSDLEYKTNAPVELGTPAQGTVVATNVAVDNAWTVDRKTQRVLLAREGEFHWIDPAAPAGIQRIRVPALPRGTFGAVLDPEGQRVLLVIVRAVNPDFAQYGVAMADLASGRLAVETTIGTTADLELLWDSQFRAWVIGDTSTGTLWRWDGDRPVFKLAGTPTGPLHAATFVETGGGVIVTALTATAMTTGQTQGDRMVWASPVTPAGTPVLTAVRHPAQAIWACLAQQGAVQHIQIRDADGKILAEAAVRPSTHLSHLLWSTYAPNRLWGVGVRALAAASI